MKQNKQKIEWQETTQTDDRHQDTCRHKSSDEIETETETETETATETATETTLFRASKERHPRQCHKIDMLGRGPRRGDRSNKRQDMLGKTETRHRHARQDRENRLRQREDT